MAIGALCGLSKDIALRDEEKAPSRVETFLVPLIVADDDLDSNAAKMFGYSPKDWHRSALAAHIRAHHFPESAPCAFQKDLKM